MGGTTFYRQEIVELAFYRVSDHRTSPYRIYDVKVLRQLVEERVRLRASWCPVVPVPPVRDGDPEAGNGERVITVPPSSTGSLSLNNSSAFRRKRNGTIVEYGTYRRWYHARFALKDI
ncbi:hypothetical protein WA026_016992 [Henosepilachna vigintioctopunctata]|uniref:Uncharacterized protein n=1 Tax=Henosepilachna vigintioctopunctata TaxID=420089 RepID=A0AAW1UB31_9CUCU